MADKYSRKRCSKSRWTPERLRYLGKRMLVGSPRWSKAVADWFIGNTDPVIRAAGAEDLCQMMDRSSRGHLKRSVVETRLHKKASTGFGGGRQHSNMAEEVISQQLLEGTDDTAEMAAGILNAGHHM